MRNTRYPGHFSGFTCECCFRKLPRSEFYLPLERIYLKHCRSCTAAQQKKKPSTKSCLIKQLIRPHHKTFFIE